jgi:4-hydroxy-2-oxoheptanedioate aldolase
VGRNHVKALSEAGPVFGMFVYSPDPALVEIAGRAGMDFVIVDTEHGQLDAHDVNALIRAARGAGMTAFVRIGEGTAHAVGRALDAGAGGVVLPHVDRSSAALAASARYAPRGTRSACTTSPATDYSLTDFASYAAEADDETWVIGLVEGQAGLEQIDDIVEHGGLDVIMPGVSDLAASIGVPGVLDHPLVVDAIDQIAASVARRPELQLAMYINDPSEVTRWAAKGVRMFVYSIDYKVVARAYAAAASGLAREFARTGEEVSSG